MIKKIIKIGELELGIAASALTPRLYRHKIGRDIIRDLKTLEKSLKKKVKVKETDEDEYEFEILDLEIFENVAYIMARQYDTKIPDNIDDWLNSLPAVFTIYEILPEILTLWDLNNKTTSTQKKL